jgi:hypothetical protein
MRKALRNGVNVFCVMGVERLSLIIPRGMEAGGGNNAYASAAVALHRNDHVQLPAEPQA